MGASPYTCLYSERKVFLRRPLANFPLGLIGRTESHFHALVLWKAERVNTQHFGTLKWEEGSTHKKEGWKGTCMAQLVKCPTLDFGSDHDLRVPGLSPAVDSLLSILPLPLPMLALSLI